MDEEFGEDGVGGSIGMFGRLMLNVRFWRGGMVVVESDVGSRMMLLGMGQLAEFTVLYE